MGTEAFFREVLGAPVRNVRWSWGALHPATGAVFLRVWEDQIRDGPDGREVMVFYHGRSNSNGLSERQRHVDRIAAGFPAFGVICVAEDPSAPPPRKIANFDSQRLLALGELRDDPDDEVVWARVEGEVAVEDYLAAALAGRATADIRKLHESRDMPPTSRDALVASRIGQGQFRTDVLAVWQGQCAVTGCSVLPAIRAGHIKPWRACTDAERLDPNNGLPLVAQLDALFDVGLITFTGKGTMKVSQELSPDQRALLGPIGEPLRERPGTETVAYLDWHRRHVFQQ